MLMSCWLMVPMEGMGIFLVSSQVVATRLCLFCALEKREPPQINMLGYAVDPFSAKKIIRPFERSRPWRKTLLSGSTESSRCKRIKRSCWKAWNSNVNWPFIGNISATTCWIKFCAGNAKKRRMRPTRWERVSSGSPILACPTVN